MSTEAPAAHAARVLVGPASMAVSANPDALLCTSPLGSCLGIAVYDPSIKVGGLLHTMLPASKVNPKRAAQRPGMFLDTGLSALLERVQNLHASAENLQFFVAGGAQVMDETSGFDIARSNCDSLAHLLEQLGFKIYAQCVGGRTNCSMELTLGTGEVRLRYCGQPTAKSLCKR